MHRFRVIFNSIGYNSLKRRYDFWPLTEDAYIHPFLFNDFKLQSKSALITMYNKHKTIFELQSISLFGYQFNAKLQKKVYEFKSDSPYLYIENNKLGVDGWYIGTIDENGITLSNDKVVQEYIKPVVKKEETEFIIEK